MAEVKVISEPAEVWQDKEVNKEVGKGKRRVKQLKENSWIAAFKGEPSLTYLNGGRGVSVVFGSCWAEVVDHLTKVTVRLEPVRVCVNVIAECSAGILCNYPGNSLRLWIVLRACSRILLEKLVVSQLVKTLLVI